MLFAVQDSRPAVAVGILGLALGIFNLVLLPTLNGGMIAFECIAALRGRPRNIRSQEILTQIGFVTLLVFMVYVAYSGLVSWILE